VPVEVRCLTAQKYRNRKETREAYVYVIVVNIERGGVSKKYTFNLLLNYKRKSKLKHHRPYGI